LGFRRNRKGDALEGLAQVGRIDRDQPDRGAGAIDINTGKYVGKSARLEDTILKTNLDAVPRLCARSGCATWAESS